MNSKCKATLSKTLFFAPFLSARPKAHKNKQCVTEPLSLLYYFFIGKFTISSDIKIFSSPLIIVSFSTPLGVLPAFALLTQQHPILILFVNNKIPNFFRPTFFTSLDWKVENEDESWEKKNLKYVCLFNYRIMGFSLILSDKKLLIQARSQVEFSFYKMLLMNFCWRIFQPK